MSVRRPLGDPTLTLPPGELPAPDAGIGDAERSRRLTEVLDQIEDNHANAAREAAIRSTA